MSYRNVVLVDELDNEVGVMEKLLAHQKGLLHRAFSIFVFNDKNEMLLQKRAKGKYHSGGLWTNTCCSHPGENESILAAGKRRLLEEMNYVCDLTPSFSFIYKVELDNELVEHELDHVLVGRSNENPILNPEEASDYKWISIEDLMLDLNKNEKDYTYWYQLILNNHKDKLVNSLNILNESL